MSFLAKRGRMAAQLLGLAVVLSAAPWGQPVWGAERAGLARIAAGLSPNSWYEIPDSSIRKVLVTQREAEALRIYGTTGPDSVINAWTGAAFDGRSSWYFHGGGHANYGGNEIYKFDFGTLHWSRVTEPSPYPGKKAGEPCPEMGDGTPLSSHTWDGFEYLAGKLWVFQGSRWCWGGDAYGRRKIWTFDLATKKWQSHPRDPIPGFAMGAVDPKTNRIALLGRAQSIWINPDASFDSRTVQTYRGGWVDAGNADIDVEGRMIWGVAVGIGLFNARLTDRLVGPMEQVIAPKDLPPGVHVRSGIVFHAPSRKLIFWPGTAEIIAFEPQTKTVQRYMSAGRGPKLGISEGVYSKFLYLPEEDVFVAYNNAVEGVWLYKPPKFD